MSLGGSSSQSKNYYKPALPYLQQFAQVGNQQLSTWNPNGPQAQASNDVLMSDVNGGGFYNPYTDAAAQAIEQQAATNLATQQAQTQDALAANGMLTSNKAGQAQALNARNSSDQVTNALNQLGSANYSAGRQLQLQAAPLAFQQSQLPYQQALQIAQLYGGLGSGSSSSNPSLLGALL